MSTPTVEEYYELRNKGEVKGNLFAFHDAMQNRIWEIECEIGLLTHYWPDERQGELGFAKNEFGFDKNDFGDCYDWPSWEKKKDLSPEEQRSLDLLTIELKRCEHHLQLSKDLVKLNDRLVQYDEVLIPADSNLAYLCKG
jgi:hypothetical protein